MKSAIAIVFIGIVLPQIAFAFQTISSYYQSIAYTITIKNNNKFTYERKTQLFVGDEAGKAYCVDYARENATREIKDIKARLYDLAGNEIRELDDDDIITSSLSEYAVYNEHEDKMFRLSHSALPYIFRSRVEVEYKTLFLLPDWSPSRDLPVENASLEIIFEEPIPISYHATGFGEPEKSIDKDGHEHWRWVATDLAAYESEYRAAPEVRRHPNVILRADRFALDDVAGNMNTWVDFGDWYYRLIGENDVFSRTYPTLQKLQHLPKTERIRRIYHLLQDKTRYVQIYLGIEGWKPHHVDQIHKNQYGDCKDLSIYFIAMLKQAGLTAYPALVKTRDSGWTMRDFTSNQFNHLIACVPLAQDTLWIDCTSDYATIDDIPDWVEGINALVIKPDGSQLIRTPLSVASENVSEIKAVGTLSPNRDLLLKGTLTYTGNTAQDLRAAFKTLTSVKQQERFIRWFSSKASSVSIHQLEFLALDSLNLPFNIDFEITLKHFARKAGSRFIFTPQLIFQVHFDGETPDDRTMPLMRLSRYTTRSDITFQLPEGMGYQKPAETDSLHSEFGHFEYTLTPEAGALKWQSHYRSNVRELPLDQYPAYYQFMTDAVKMAEKKVVLAKE